jgi:hypothetical protein
MEQLPASGSDVLDLDAYREQRIKDGTWPIDKDRHYAFFHRWLKDKKK